MSVMTRLDLGRCPQTGWRPPQGLRQRGRCRAREAMAYLSSPVVGVSFGLSTPPEFGMIVSCKVVGGMVGKTSARFYGLSATQSIP
jgi:hypothetical protein